MKVLTAPNGALVIECQCGRITAAWEPGLLIRVYEVHLAVSGCEGDAEAIKEVLGMVV